MKQLFLLLALIFVGSGLSATELNEYTVPVSPGLETWGTFLIPEAHLRIRKGRADFEYKMPPELAGEEILKLEAKGDFYKFEKPISLSGKFIKSATCELTGDLARCQIVYRSELPILTAEGRKSVEEYLRKTISDPRELESRLQVLEEFVNGRASGISDGHEAGGKFERLKVRYR